MRFFRWISNEIFCRRAALGGLLLSDTISSILHTISQALRLPCLLVLCLLILVALWQSGSTLAEYLIERRRKIDVPALLHALHEGRDSPARTVAESPLLPRHKRALTVLAQADALPPAARTALARDLLSQEEDHCGRVTGITDMAVKLGPMFGLLGTLIPLGPGIVALGQGDTAALAQSLTGAFDTTIVGIVTAAVCAVLSRLRKRWYENDLAMLEAAMECILEEGAYAA